MKTQSIHPSHLSIHYGWIVLGLIILTVFSALGLGRFGYTSILPAMQDAMRLSNVQTGELQSWNLGGYLLTVLFAGVLATRFGPRVVISAALLITGLAMILTGLIPTFNGARWGRFLAGVGGAGANIPAMALISSWFAIKRRGMAAGLGVTGSSFGLMVTGPLIPWVLQHQGSSHGWQVCWYILGSLALLACGICALFLRNRPAEAGLAPIGESPAERSQRDTESRTSALDWSLVYRSLHLWHLAVVYFAFGFSYIVYSTFFIRYLGKEGSFTSTSAGHLWLTIGLVSSLSGFLWGGLSDLWGRRWSLLSVFCLQGTAFLILGLSLDRWVVYLSSGLFALTAWSIPALMAALSGDLFGARLAPAALGLMTIIFGIGQALAPYFAGYVADATHSFSLAYVTAGLVSLVLGAGGAYILPARRNTASGTNP